MEALLTLLVFGSFLSTVLIASQEQVFGQPSKDTDPCKAFKALAKYVELLGLNAVATGDKQMMSALADEFRHYANSILDLPTPEKGRC